MEGELRSAHVALMKRFECLKYLQKAIVDLLRRVRWFTMPSRHASSEVLKKSRHGERTRIPDTTDVLSDKTDKNLTSYVTQLPFPLKRNASIKSAVPSLDLERIRQDTYYRRNKSTGLTFK